jgi:hypothetical protein
MFELLLLAFKKITDNRVIGRTKYRLTEILIIFTISVLVGNTSWKGIHLFAVGKLKEFKALGLKHLNSIPSVDTISRTIACKVNA